MKIGQILYYISTSFLWYIFLPRHISCDEKENGIFTNLYILLFKLYSFFYLRLPAGMLVCALTLYSQPVSWLEGIAPIWVQNEVSCCTLSCKLHILKHIRVTIFVLENKSHSKTLCELGKRQTEVQGQIIQSFIIYFIQRYFSDKQQLQINPAARSGIWILRLNWYVDHRCCSFENHCPLEGHWTPSTCSLRQNMTHRARMHQPQSKM